VVTSLTEVDPPVDGTLIDAVVVPWNDDDGSRQPTQLLERLLNRSVWDSRTVKQVPCDQYRIDRSFQRYVDDQAQSFPGRLVTGDVNV
jgi:hypothetical protein